MTKLSDFSQGVLITVIVLYICIFLYALRSDTKKDAELRKSNNPDDRYTRFAEELSEDLYKYNIEKVDRTRIEDVINEILDKREKEKSLFLRLVNSGKNGVLIGGLSGGITSGPPGALAAGILFGLVNPIVIIINEFIFVPEELSATKAAKKDKMLRN